MQGKTQLQKYDIVKVHTFETKKYLTDRKGNNKNQKHI